MQQLLKDDLDLRYEYKIAKSRLTLGYKNVRTAFVNKHKFRREEFENIVFRVGAKFNLDGTDGHQKYQGNV